MADAKSLIEESLLKEYEEVMDSLNESDVSSLKAAAAKLQDLSKASHAASLNLECIDDSLSKTRDKLSVHAVNLYYKNDIESLNEAKELFDLLGFSTQSRLTEKASAYLRAEKAFETHDYETALGLYKKAGDHKDAKQKAELCEQKTQGVRTADAAAAAGAVPAASAVPLTKSPSPVSTDEKNQSLRMICAGLFALTALLNLIFAITRIKYRLEYLREYDIEGLGVYFILFVISLFIIAAGSGMAAYYLFAKRDAKIGYIIIAAGYALSALELLIETIQDAKAFEGYYYDGFWSYHLLLFVSEALFACVFFVYFLMLSSAKTNRKTTGTILIIASAIAFAALLLSGIGEEITINTLEKVCSLTACVAAVVLPFFYGWMGDSSSALPAPGAAAERVETVPQIVSAGRPEPTLENFDQIRQYKELFDAGIITEAQFKEFKKQLLGI